MHEIVMIPVQQSILLTISASNLAIGTWVLSKNPRHLVNRSFFLFVLGASAWSTGVSLLYITNYFVFDKLALGGGLIMLFGISLFARVFPATSRVPRTFFLVYIPLAIALICLPFNLFISAVISDEQGYLTPVNGPLFPYFVLITIGYSGAALYYFYTSFRNSSGKARLQMQYFSLGIGVFMASLTVFDAILPLAGIYHLNLLGPAASLLFVVLTSYAIVRHQLLDIRIVIQRGAVYSILVSLITAAYVGMLLIANYLFDLTGTMAAPLSAGLVTIVGIVTIPRLERYFQKRTNHFFFREPYDYAQSLEKLGEVLNEHISFSRMVPQLLRALDETLHPESIVFAHTASKTTYDISKKKPMYSEELLVPQGGTKIYVQARKRNIGTFILGRKRGGDEYSSQDIALLRTFAAQAAVAFEKAELYQQLQTYSHSLEEKVQERTKNIAELQAHQRQLFDDISHALQTPLTVLKGAMELVLADHTSNDVQALEPMEHSIDDLSRLIREILQLARIDAVPVPEQEVLLDISALVESVIEYVEVICRQHDITITKHITPGIVLMGNEKEIEESIINLLSNAVRYTSTSEVRNIAVTLSVSDTHIRLAIEDTGIGIAAERLPHIFERFYRGNERDNTGNGGYGLGLAIVKRIVERHGGNAYAESTLGKGTTMILEFPNTQKRTTERLPAKTT